MLISIQVLLNKSGEGNGRGREREESGLQKGGQEKGNRREEMRG